MAAAAAAAAAGRELLDSVYVWSTTAEGAAVTELPVPLGCGAAAGEAFHLRVVADVHGGGLAAVAAATGGGKLLLWPAPTAAPHQVVTGILPAYTAAATALVLLPPAPALAGAAAVVGTACGLLFEVCVCVCGACCLPPTCSAGPYLAFGGAGGAREKRSSPLGPQTT